METVGAFEAKTHLSSLLERVAKGEAFTITRHGKPVAQLVPVERRDPERIRAAIKRMREIAVGQTLGGDWREFRDAGRKW
ncbi:MAG: type II toxin-antitoxin system prevent-host-death family antitoxin [Acetobacteraceae bacterium]|jgi:prevent-host-death family protein